MKPLPFFKAAAPISLLLLACCLLAPAQSQPAQGAERLELETARLRVAFTQAAHGGLVSLVDLPSGRDLIAKQAKPRLFELEFSDPRTTGTARLAFNNWDAGAVALEPAASAPSPALRLTFSNFGRLPIEARCLFRAEPGDPFLRCRIEVTVPPGLVLERVRFPMFNLRPQPAGAAADALVLGATKGGVHPRPSAAKVGTTLSAAQPGDLAAQFGCWYNDRDGLFLAAFDARGWRKSLVFVRGNDGIVPSWSLPLFERGAYTQDFDFVLTTFHGADAATPPDWRDAADLYKTWALQQPWCARTLAQRGDLPAWLKEGPAMVRFSRDWLAAPDSIEAWFKSYWKNNFPQGTPLVIAYWGWEKVQTWITPDYFPVFPSDAQFRHLAEVGRALGGHTFLWPSGYHYTLTYDKRPDGTFAWDDRKRFDEIARPHAVQTRDGKLYLRESSWLRGGATTCMCPGDPWTIDWFNRIAEGLAERGAELIQVDQVVGGNFPACYRADHGHAPGPGLWCTDVIRKQLQTMLEACRKIQPGAVVCFEEPNELFIQQAGIQDYRDWEVLKHPTTEPASVFNYLYHEYLPTFQSNPRRGDRLMAAWCFANGQIPHLVPERESGPGPLLVGGDFERPGGGEPAEGWQHVTGYQGRVYSGEVVRDEAEHHDGRASLRLSNGGANGIAQAGQNITVGTAFAPGKTYQLSAWIKTRGLKNPNAILLGAFTESMKSMGSWKIVMPMAEGDWTRGQTRFTLPAGAKMLRLMLHLQGPGTVWIDGLRLDEVRADGSLAEVQRPERPDDHAFMAGWVKLFHGEGRPYLLLGRFLHPPRLECATQEAAGRRLPAILHNAFAAPDGSQAVILVNATGGEQVGKLTWNGQTNEIRLAPWEARLVR